MPRAIFLVALLVFFVVGEALGDSPEVFDEEKEKVRVFAGSIEPPKLVGLRVVEETILPSELRWAADIRWNTQERLVVAAGKRGVVEIDRSGRVTGTVIAEGVGTGELWNANRIGVSNQLVVGAAPFFSLIFLPSDAGGPGRDREYAAILDLDVAGSTALVLGARRDEAGRWAHDRATAWLDNGIDEPEAVHFLSDSVNNDAVSRCGVIDIGAVKILSDRSFVVVPGVDSGVFWYTAEGRLKRVWQSSRLGLAGDCRLNDKENLEFHKNLEPRWAYWNSNVLVDDVVEVENRPALLIRKRHGDVTLWEFLILSSNGDSLTLQLPFRSPSGLTRARADVRGDSLVVLLHESGRTAVQPQFQPRLVFLEIGK